MVDLHERIFAEPDDVKAYRAALFLAFAGHDIRRIEAEVMAREQIGGAIAAEMRRGLLSQVDLARRSGIDQAVISRALRGGRASHKAKLELLRWARIAADEKTS